MDQPQIAAPGNDLLFPMAVPGSAIPPVLPEPQQSRHCMGWHRAGSSDQRQPQNSSSSSSSSSPPDSHQALPYKLQGLQGQWVQL